MRILIIEDILEHMMDIHAFLLRKGHEVMPKQQDHEKLQEEIIRCLEKGNDLFYVEEAMAYLKKYIADFDPDLVLVDYELKEGEKSVNGSTFIDTFVKDRNILIVTGQKENEVNNTIQAILKQAKNNTRREVCYKHKNLDEAFFEIFGKLVDTFEEPITNDKAVKFRPVK